MMTPACANSAAPVATTATADVTTADTASPLPTLLLLAADIVAIAAAATTDAVSSATAAIPARQPSSSTFFPTVIADYLRKSLIYSKRQLLWSIGNIFFRIPRTISDRKHPFLMKENIVLDLFYIK